jgi:hypothetical protein
MSVGKIIYQPNIIATIKESALNDHNCRIGIDTKYN